MYYIPLQGGTILAVPLVACSHFRTNTIGYISVGRFRIFGGGGGGGARFRILGRVGKVENIGGGGGVRSQQAHSVVMTSMRRNDVASTSFAH